MDREREREGEREREIASLTAGPEKNCYISLSEFSQHTHTWHLRNPLYLLFHFNVSRCGIREWGESERERVHIKYRSMKHPEDTAASSLSSAAFFSPLHPLYNCSSKEEFIFGSLRSHSSTAFWLCLLYAHSTGPEIHCKCIERVRENKKERRIRRSKFLNTLCVWVCDVRRTTCELQPH